MVSPAIIVFFFFPKNASFLQGDRSFREQSECHAHCANAQFLLQETPGKHITPPPADGSHAGVHKTRTRAHLRR